MVARLAGTEVFSLLVLEGGDLLAGCGPEGQLYRIDKDGQATLLDSVPGGYIWAMAPDPRGDVVWLAAGTEHTSYSPGGCLIAVYAEEPESVVPAG